MVVGKGSTMSAMELLELGDLDREKSVLSKYWCPLLGSFFGVMTGVVANGCTKRPPFSGIHRHIIAVCIWTSALQTISNWREDYFAEKDMVLRHYVELHPEDFPPEKRRKIGDILEDWAPIR